MIRPFNLRDLPLIRRLSEQGVSLHTESALTNNLNSLREALFSLVGGDYPTFVWKLDTGSAAGFIQLLLDEDEQHARIIYISPNDEVVDSGEQNDDQISNEDLWLPLLDQAVVEIGSRGIHSLVAEVSETGPELPILRRAGFAIYTRQDIWRLDEVGCLPEPKLEMVPRRPVDDWDIQLLYGNMVPRLVQLVEPVPPLNRGGSWLLRENGELAAFGHMRNGSIATWLRLFIHPNAEAQADEIVAAMVQIAGSKAARPIYCCVRRYQSWLERPLQDAGFIHWGSQAVMVKHTVHHVPRTLPEAAAVLDPKHVPASAPMIPHYDRSRVNGKAKIK
ncbi:MAG: hypothetical protein H6667_07115 [Ardenticatenaceae bacterium]|nr:hypothetical protein [Ardenticatenaceae bacterium]MCB9444154.1 hypothetical protein [Ardenticatenaceae bacterium]